MRLLGYGQRCSIAGSDGRICCNCTGFVPKVVRVCPTHHMHTPEGRSRTFGTRSQRILNSVRHPVEMIFVSILEIQNGVHFLDAAFNPPRTNLRTYARGLCSQGGARVTQTPHAPPR